MKFQSSNIKSITLLISLVILMSCSTNNDEEVTTNNGNITLTNPNGSDESEGDSSNENYADIDFNNWKITLPVDENNNGSPDEYQPSELINGAYRTNTSILPYMYDNTENASIVFYTVPGTSTTNSSYSRTELRELINPNNSKENWTLLEGGEMKGRLKVDSVSENNSSSDDYHKVIIMQIHGIISIEDMNTYNFNGNNGPPLIKIYWKDGFVWSHKKSLIDESTSGDDLLETSNNTWYDIKVNLGYVGFDAFDFRITASDAKIEVQLNDDDTYIYEDVSLDKWPFENYFKAGNYLTTTHDNAFSYVKYYNLSVAH